MYALPCILQLAHLQVADVYTVTGVSNKHIFANLAEMDLEADPTVMDDEASSSFSLL